MQNVIRTCAPQPSRSPSKPDRYAAQAAGAASSGKSAATAPMDILLVIVPGYSLLSLGCIVEPLMAAQTLATVQPFALSLYDLGPGATSAVKEFRISAARALPELEARISARPAPGAIFFCCGFDVPHHARAPLRRVMRQAHRASLLRYAPQIVQDTVGRMGRNLENPIGINALAEAAGVSQRQLERLFGQYLNAPPRKFYCDLQLGLAWQLCEQTDLPVVEIALAAGFSSHAALSRKFKIRYSITPSEMRAGVRVLRRPTKQNIAVIGAVEGTA